jgi:NAD(P)-dependent dehydrogenase (short-subunit alcohol dehydrogenase family)
VVVGGSSGIGLATASRFCREGARVAVTGRDREALGRTIDRSGLSLSPFTCDLRDAESIATLTDAIRKWTTGLDVLFVNAGISRPAPASEVTTAFFDEHFETNFKGAFFAIQALMPILSDGASVILTTSCLDRMGRPGMAVYSASKAAMRSLVRTLAAELAPRSIRVNAVAPGPVDSGIHAKMGLSPDAAEARKAQTAEQIPLRRLGTVDEIAGAVAFLASPDAAFITGHELVVDGGWSAI